MESRYIRYGWHPSMFYGVWRKIDIQFLDKRGIVMPEDYGAALRTMNYQEAAAYTISRFSLQETVPDVIREWHEMAVFEYGHTIGLRMGLRSLLRHCENRGYDCAGNGFIEGII
ncbi:MAG: hypothetical protein ACLR23_29865 [Clostridia bacterium]